MTLEQWLAFAAFLAAWLFMTLRVVESRRWR